MDDWHTVNEAKMDLMRKLQPHHSKLIWRGGQLVFLPGDHPNLEGCGRGSSISDTTHHN